MQRIPNYDSKPSCNKRGDKFDYLKRKQKLLHGKYHEQSQKKKIHKQGENSCNIYHRKMDTVPIIIMDIKIGG